MELKKYHARKIIVFLRGPMTWKVMPRNVWNYIVRLANKTTQQLYKVSTPCIDDHHVKEEEMKSVGELPHVMLSNCSDFFIFGTTCKTLIF